MHTLPKAHHAASLILALALAGCAGVRPTPYAGIDSSAQLRASEDKESDRIPYRYTTPTNWKTYSSVMIDPVTIYKGTDHQFGEVKPEDQQTLADYMQEQFGKALKERYRIVASPGPDTLRVHLVLTGAETTTPVLGTFTKIDLGGGIYNIVQSVRGKEGMMTGSVSYAVEIYDAPTNRLLQAYVAKQYPNAMNIGASFGSLGASKVGIEKGAEELAMQMK